MVKGGNIRSKSSTRTRVQSHKNDSDKSDEDYKVDEEFNESEDEYCSSIDEHELKDSLSESEEEWAKTKVNKGGKPIARKGVRGRKKNRLLQPKRKKVVQKSRKRVSVKEDEDDEEDDDFNYKKPRKKAKLSYKEEKEDDDYNDTDFEEDDEDFTLAEIDGADDEEDLASTKKQLRKPSKRKKGTVKVRKRRTRGKILKKTKRKRPRKNQGPRRKTRSPCDSTVQRKKKKLTVKGRRKKAVYSKSDHEVSGSSSYQYTMSEEEREQVREATESSYQYTMSEEEREQVREATEFCGSLTISLRSSRSSKMNENEIQSPGRKGKEKVEDTKKIEAGNQVCGICLSEEGKRTVRGTLNSCSHYFCFACIMEWSKVESRCPLCKQRFSSISKATRSVSGHYSKNVVISVPARDQVYQPSEEDLRNFLEPYENVLCIECQLGGDDALMLLCDICDSPAHTYCVGLGREVPEGNWYCEGCRPIVLASSSAQDGATNNLSAGSSPLASVHGPFDLNELYIPEITTPSTPRTNFSRSPRFHDSQASSPASGMGAYTVFERRRIQNQINHLLNRSRQQDSTNGVPIISGNNLLSRQIGRVTELAPQHTVTDSLYSREASSPSRLRVQTLHNQASTSTDHREFADHQHPHPHRSRSNVINDVCTLPPPLREVNCALPEKEQVQSMVRRHLKSLSRDLELGYSTFKDIARRSTHTVLASCGLDHRPTEVHPVHSCVNCDHIEGVATVQSSMVKGQCSSCFDLFVRNVVRDIMITRIPGP